MSPEGLFAFPLVFVVVVAAVAAAALLPQTYTSFILHTYMHLLIF